MSIKDMKQSFQFRQYQKISSFLDEITPMFYEAFSVMFTRMCLLV